MILLLIMAMRRASAGRPRRVYYDRPESPPLPKPYKPPMDWRTRFFLTRESQRLFWA